MADREGWGTVFILAFPAKYYICAAVSLEMDDGCLEGNEPSLVWLRNCESTTGSEKYLEFLTIPDNHIL